MPARNPTGSSTTMAGSRRRPATSCEPTASTITSPRPSRTSSVVMSGHPRRAAPRRRHPNGVIERRSPGSEDDRGPRASYGRWAARHRAARTTCREGHVDAEELLRRLALNDENVVRSAVGAAPLPLSGGPELDAKTNALVRLAALLSIGAATSSCRAAVECARAAAATDT